MFADVHHSLYDRRRKSLYGVVRETIGTVCTLQISNAAAFRFRVGLGGGPHSWKSIACMQASMVYTIHNDTVSQAAASIGSIPWEARSC